MNITKKQKQWLIVLAGFLLSGVNVGINTNCNTAFLNPVCEDLGLSISSFALTASIVSFVSIATVYKGNIIKNLIMDCQSYTKYRPNETTGGIFVSWRRKEELPTGA